MRNNVQLYINDQLVDLFDFEDINIVDSIQDVRDISKVFVPYSRQFTVPASKNNNKIFNHYYNTDVLNSFDARFKIGAVIKINGQIYKKGRLSLSGVSLKNNKAYNYKVVFYENTIDLKTIIGDKLLSDLGAELVDYNITYSYLNVLSAFQYGYNLVGGNLVAETTPPSLSEQRNTPCDVIIPFISSNNYYFNDSVPTNVSPIDGDVESRNVHEGASLAIRGINWKDLRPSIRVKIILDAIAEKFNLTFAGDFFNTSNENFNRLYLWLNADKGLYGEEKTYIKDLTDFSFDSGTSQLPITTSNVIGYKLYSSVTVDNVTDEYNFIVRDKLTGEELKNTSGKGNVVFETKINATTRVYDIQFEINGATTLNIGIDVNVQKWSVDKFKRFNTLISSGSYSISEAFPDASFNMAKNMPKIKIIDFITGLFKMFNLTAYSDENDNIVINTLDDYYLMGNTIDITKFINTDKIEVNKNKLYSQIDFVFEEPKTFAIINSNIATLDEFGNERIDNQNDDPILQSLFAFDGGEYEVAPKFEKIQYERMTDQDTGVLTNIGWGWCVDKDQNAITTNPILHYTENIDLSVILGDQIQFDNLTGTYSFLDSYYRPSNSLTISSTFGQSLNFGSEFDEYYYDLGTNEVSLFNVYWKNTILAIYDKKSRIVNLKAIFPTSLINTIKINDILVVNRKKYRINKIDINITTGMANLELVTYREIIPYNGIDINTSITVDTDIITVDSELITVDKTI